MPDACYDRSVDFRLKWFLKDRAPLLKIVGNRPFWFTISVVYPAHAILLPVVADMFFFETFFGRDFKPLN